MKHLSHEYIRDFEIQCNKTFAARKIFMGEIMWKLVTLNMILLNPE